MLSLNRRPYGRPSYTFSLRQARRSPDRRRFPPLVRKGPGWQSRTKALPLPPLAVGADRRLHLVGRRSPLLRLLWVSLT